MMTYVASVVKDTFDRERNGDDNNKQLPTLECTPKLDLLLPCLCLYLYLNLILDKPYGPKRKLNVKT